MKESTKLRQQNSRNHARTGSKSIYFQTFENNVCRGRTKSTESEHSQR